MDFTLSEEQQMLRDSARDFLAKEWPSAEMRRMLGDEAQKATGEIWRKIVELGWPSLLVSEDYDGLGSGVFEILPILGVVKHAHRIRLRITDTKLNFAGLTGLTDGSARHERILSTTFCGVYEISSAAIAQRAPARVTLSLISLPSRTTMT